MNNLFSLGLGSVATLLLVSCSADALEFSETPKKGIPYEISTSFTKTTNQGLATTWANEDSIIVFHAESGTTSYVKDGKFTVDADLTGRFSGEISETLPEGGSQDWYAFYPYNSYIATPANTSKGWTTIGGISQSQSGNDSRAHLAGESCPLYGIARNVPSSVRPSLVMKQLSSVVAVKVNNMTERNLTVNVVKFVSTEDIVGTYYIDYSSDVPSYKKSGASYVSNTATLSVEEGSAIASGASATFYLVVKPHVISSGSDITLIVNGCKKTISLSKNVEFKAGSIKTLSFDFAGGTNWLELPAESGSYSQYTYYGDDGETRNYTHLYDTSTMTSFWTAYPLNSSYMGSESRPTKWYYSPLISTDYQVNVTSHSYSNSTYSRGHMCPNASRNGDATMQKQTFYVTNQVPQIQNKFNGGIWASLESAVQTLAKSNSSDTLYVVTGVAFQKVGESKTISYVSPTDDSSQQVPIPNYFYKLVLRVKTSGGVVTDASTVAFWFEHQTYSDSYTNYTVSVDQVEEWTGFDFFVNLPDSIESAAESRNTSWSEFSSF